MDVSRSRMRGFEVIDGLHYKARLRRRWRGATESALEKRL